MPTHPSDEERETRDSGKAGAVRTRRKAERPGEILEAAFEEFVQKGYAATRLEDVAARAGVTKGTIYVYFENKEQVFVAMVRELSRPVHVQAEEFAESSASSTAEFLRAYLCFLYRILATDPRGREIFRLLIAEANRFPELIDEHHQNFMGPVVRRLRQSLEDGAERGEIRRSSILEFPELLLSPALSLNISMLLFSDRRPIDMERHFEIAVDLLLNGLLQRPAGKADQPGQSS
ncbi:TetR/AcrR family transcriptional regulator [Microvirga makkahensis]|uniref:TetR family transcriptional regulator n=1 Tax=Microvirga makkahensis TaxID=1128670 RepID=A0A7X3SQI4_9HYPH|nr:TetR/AcrR family transcriptional regulator [Microvirga makkahensis]MXQ13385.1 TetR family transcriptional regulator [Microvirga makkahensis]